MICSNCNNRLPDNDKSCQFCGVKLKYCKQCGGLISNISSICSGCGKRYLKISWFTIVLLTILVIMSIVICAIAYEYCKLDTELYYSQITIDKLNLKINDLNLTIENQEKSLATLGAYEESTDGNIYLQQQILDVGGAIGLKSEEKVILLKALKECGIDRIKSVRFLDQGSGGTSYTVSTDKFTNICIWISGRMKFEEGLIIDYNNKIIYENGKKKANVR